MASANVKALEADHGVLWFDIDRDGDLDLAFVGAQATGMHRVLCNDLDTGAAHRAPFAKVVSGKRRATRAGAEVRLDVADTRTLLGTQLTDTGIGDNAQNDLPVHC